MSNQKMVLSALNGAIEHLKQHHSAVALNLLLSVQADIESHLANSVRYELFRTASFDEKSIEATILQSICDAAEFPKSIEMIDQLFDQALAAIKGFKDAQEAIK